MVKVNLSDISLLQEGLAYLMKALHREELFIDATPMGNIIRVARWSHKRKCLRPADRACKTIERKREDGSRYIRVKLGEDRVEVPSESVVYAYYFGKVEFRKIRHRDGVVWHNHPDNLYIPRHTQPVKRDVIAPTAYQKAFLAHRVLTVGDAADDVLWKWPFSKGVLKRSLAQFGLEMVERPKPSTSFGWEREDLLLDSYIASMSHEVPMPPKRGSRRRNMRKGQTVPIDQVLNEEWFGGSRDDQAH